MTHRAGRPWVTVATWTATVAPLPYSVSRILWAAGVPAGIDADLLRDLHAPGWGSLYIVGLALLADAVAVLIHVLVRPRARVVPGWVPLLGDRPVRPRIVIALLLLPLAVLSWRAALHLRLVAGGFRIPDDVTGVPDWSLWAQAALVWVWGISLAATTLAYHRAMRRPVAGDQLAGKSTSSRL